MSTVLLLWFTALVEGFLMGVLCFFIISRKRQTQKKDSLISADIGRVISISEKNGIQLNVLINEIEKLNAKLDRNMVAQNRSSTGPISPTYNTGPDAPSEFAISDTEDDEAIELIEPATEPFNEDRLIETWNRFSKQGFRQSTYYDVEDWESALGVRPHKFKEGKDELFVFENEEAPGEYFAVPPVATRPWRNSYMKWFYCEYPDGAFYGLIRPARLRKTDRPDDPYEVIKVGEINT